MSQQYFPEPFMFKAPAGFVSALKDVARREHMTASEFVRQLVIRKLREEGVPIVPPSNDQRLVA